MSNVAGTYYWIRLGFLALLSLLAIVAAFRLMRTRAFSAGKGIAIVVLEIIALGGLWFVTGSSPSAIWLIVMLAVGAVVGFLSSRASKPAGDKLRRSPVGAAVSAIAFVFAAMTLLFGTSYLFSISLLGIALATGLLGGQLVGETQAAKAVPESGEAAPPPMPASPPPMPAAPPPMPGAGTGQ